MIAVFPLVGPIVGALVFVVLFTVFGIFTMGPGAFLVALMYFVFWLPALYGVFGLPFLLTGVLYALAVRFFAPESLVTAVFAAAAAFPAYLGARYLIFGTIASGETHLGPNVWADSSAAIWPAVGVIPCWWLVRDRNSPRTRWW